MARFARQDGARIRVTFSHAMNQATETRESPPAASFGRRWAILGGLFFLWMAGGCGRLFYLQVIKHADWVAKAHRQQQRTVEVNATRGIIYDRNFHELAMSVEVESVFAVPAEIPAPENTAQLLARVLNVSAAELLDRMRDSRSFCWVKRRVDPIDAERVRALNLTGIYFQKENKRFYPKRELASHILGYVGLDENGLAGVEQEFDRQIRGKPGVLLIQADARHRWYGRNERPPEAGENVVLTIDEKVQFIAERELDAAMNETSAKAGTVVVMEPNTGQILAMANRPTFNPNAYGQVPAESWIDRAVASAYEPGSTFKIVTVAAALEEKLTRPDEVIDCQMGSITIFGHRIRDHKAYGMLTVNEIIQNSSDVGAIKLGLRLGDERMYRYIRAFGFGAPTGIELPGEARGLTKPAERWSKISIGAISMGQEVGVTPLQMVNAVAAIANGGRLNKPRIVRGTFRKTPPPGQFSGLAFAADRTEEAAGSKQVVSPETAAALRHAMQMVVMTGTGKKAQLNGWTSAGKTGTAQKADPRGGYSRTDYIASFVGFAPVNNPAVVILVTLDSPRGSHQGGWVSAPVFKRIAEQVLSYYDVPRDLPTRPEKNQPQVQDDQVADFAAPETEPEDGATPDSAPAAAAAGSTVVVDLEGAPTVPDFTGKSMRVVFEQALSAGVDVQVSGTGLAREQYPAPGSHLIPGGRIVVKFGR